MGISYRIAGPVAALGFLALAVAGFLLWALGDGASLDRASTRAAVAAHVATIRQAQRTAASLAALRPDGSDGVHALLHDVAAAAVADAEAIRRLAAGQPYAPAAARLAAETARWRDDVETLSHPPAAATGAAADPAEPLASRRMLILQLTDGIAQGAARAEADGRAALWAGRLRAATFLSVVLGAAAAALVVAALASSRRLARDMAALPRAVQALSEGAEPVLTGEDRDDEFGGMARRLRAFAESMRQMTRSRAEMERMALTDPLTGLPNRRGLYDFLAKRGSRRRTERGTVAVLHIDLDHFKTINDANGHEAGDFVLREATRRMALVIRDSDILARVGGDEFVVFAHGLTSLASLERLAERIITQFEEPVVFRGCTLRVTASIGAVLGGRRGRVLDPNRLLISADIALAHAKAAGRNRCSVFTSAMARDARRLRERAGEVRDAIGRGEFRIWFRPVMDMRTGRPSALDLVPRWHHPTRGILTPAAFMGAAEAHSLTEAMALPAYERAFAAVASWRAAGLPVLPLHVGVSRTLLLSPGFVDRLGWLLEQSRIDPERIAVSIAESYCSGRGTDAVFESLRRLADRGSTILIDDFGSVDAALANITRIGATAIKVDVRRASNLVRGGRRSDGDIGERRLALLSGMIRIGESLQVRVQAKGVSERGTVERLLARGFAEMQGDAVAPALDETAAADWLAAAGSGPVRLAAG